MANNRSIPGWNKVFNRDTPFTSPLQNFRNREFYEISCTDIFFFTIFTGALKHQPAGMPLIF